MSSTRCSMRLAELEAEARSDYKGLGRRAMIATLGLAGLRISELVDLRVAQVDLTRGRFKLADAKTEAGVREVEITLYLRDELLEHVMDRRARALPLEPSDHFFGTSTGNRRDPDRFRDRILARAVERASSEPNRRRPGAPARDHTSLAAPNLGDVRGDDRPRPQVDRRADRARESRRSRSPSTSRSRPAATSTSKPSGR